MTASFVISLDFELHWGLRDHTPLAPLRERLLRTRAVIPVLLGVFDEFEVHATWATVGYLFAQSKEELLTFAPTHRPDYPSPQHDPFSEVLGADEDDDPFHFAPSLVGLIAGSPHQEVATHTFSHYYTQAPWADAVTFAADLEAAKAIALARGITLETIVLPRNQINVMTSQVIQAAGLIAFRGNPKTWEWEQASGARVAAQRAMRLLDAYLPLRRVGLEERPARLADITAARFMRPVSHLEGGLWRIRLRRIMREMTQAARQGRRYHLWWHPHNFGDQLEHNMRMLREILHHRAALDAQYGMPSLTMSEAARRG